MNKFEQFLAESLMQINEIGDTERGREFIRKAWKKRKSQVDKATDTVQKDLAKHGAAAAPDRETADKMARAEAQVNKVAGYMGGRLSGELVGATLPKKSDPGGKIAKELADTGASMGYKGAKKEFADTTAKITAKAKKKNWGPTGKSTKSAAKKIESDSRKLNWEQDKGSGIGRN